MNAKQAGSAVSLDRVAPPNPRGLSGEVKPEVTPAAAPEPPLTVDPPSPAMSSTSVTEPETAASPESTTTPGASSVGQEPGTARSVLTTEAEDEIDDHFRHIVCVLCYPAFKGTRQAPQDAICICGKRLSKGDEPSPPSAPQCILCNEMCDRHFSVAHGDDD